MGVQTLLEPRSHEGFKFNFVPLSAIALSVFCLSGLAFYHVQLSGTGVSNGLFQALVVGVYQTLGFVPSFMFFLLVLSWGSIWFITGTLAEPPARLGRLVLLTLALSVLVNLQPEVGPPAPHSGLVGHFLASRLESIFGYTLSTLLVAPLALVTLLLATDFFFYRYFETLGRSTVPDGGRAARELGVEDEATETLKSLRFSEASSAEPRSGPALAVMPEPVELVVAEEAPAPATRGRRRVLLDLDEEIPWQAPDEPPVPPPELGAGVAVADDVEDEVVSEEVEPEDAEYEADLNEDDEAEEDLGDQEASQYEEGVEEEEDEEEEEEEEDEDEDDEVELAVGEGAGEDAVEIPDLSLDEPQPERSSRKWRTTRLGEGGARSEGSQEQAAEEQLIMFLDEEEEPELQPEVEAEKVVLIPRPGGVPELVQEARSLVVGTGRVSASFLQRRLRVGFDEAMGLLQALKVQGVIRIGDNESHGTLA